MAVERYGWWCPEEQFLYWRKPDMAAPCSKCIRVVIKEVDKTEKAI